jgi:hypothetical protein
VGASATPHAVAELGRSRACAPDTKQTNVEIAKAEPSSGHRCILFIFPRSIESSI